MKYAYQQTYTYGSTEVDQNVIKRVQDCAFIPNNPDNTDWQQYQEWLAQGNKPLPPEGAK